MSAPLQSVSIVAPGFAGLNTQDSSLGLPKEFALRAENAVIDQYGRIASRKGWDNLNSAVGYSNTEPTLITEIIKTDGTQIIASIGDNKIFTGTSTLTQVYNGSAWTAQNWKAVTFNGHTYFFQRAHEAISFEHSTNTWQLISADTHYAGTAPQANEALAAYGRLWVADTSTDKTTVWWSDTLIGAKWTGGTSGSISIEKAFTNGTDSIVALAAFNGYLVIFCKRSIVIYTGATTDPSSNLSLVEVIDGVGCIARDSIQDVGTDIFFLSDTGVRSLGRIIQEKSPPLFDVSKNIRDDLIADVNTNNGTSDIRSVYYEKDGFYLLSLPTAGVSYCFDLKGRLQDNSCRVTKWTIAPKSLAATSTRKLYLGRISYIGDYGALPSDNGDSFRFAYYTAHLDASAPSVLKMLKKLSLFLIGGLNTNVFLYSATDYGSLYSTTQINNVGGTTRSEYNISEYNIAEYNSGAFVNNAKVSLNGTGRVFQIGIEANISADSLSIQQMDVYFKTGRLA